jgi:hypothetical protein
MLVVMLILLTATALAGVSLQATQYELRAAGFDRTATQTQYVSETAMATTLSWVDAISLIGGAIAVQTASGAPQLGFFGEPVLTAANSALASRTQWSQQSRLAGVTIPPITMPGSNNDPIGTFGPKSTYHPGTEDPLVTDATLSDYVVDMYDCQMLPGGSAGSQVNTGGSGAAKVKQLYCVVTARGRSFLFGATSTFPNKTKTWTTSDGTNYVVNRYTVAHDSRGTFVSPPFVAQ